MFPLYFHKVCITEVERFGRNQPQRPRTRNKKTITENRLPDNGYLPDWKETIF